MNYKKLNPTHYSYLKYIFDTVETQDIFEFIKNSKIYLADDDYARYDSSVALLFMTSPEVDKKYYDRQDYITEKIRERLEQKFGYFISKQNIKPDLSLFELMGNNYKAVITQWGEINQKQSDLITQFENANTDIDFQNIGNTCRIILQKLADAVFDPKKLIAEGIDLGSEKYKNRLHTYIVAEVSGSQMKEIKEYASSLIDTVKKAIDLSNNLTHDLNANRMIAESCLIGTISVIGIIKVIDQN